MVWVVHCRVLSGAIVAFQQRVREVGMVTA
jgi:hypothetical protein